MPINKDSLKARANNISRELKISQNIIYNRFFFDAFLNRLAFSIYKDKFLLKGGLYLSSVLGINTRSTMDIDFYAHKLSIEQDNIIKIFTEIISINLKDNITFKIIEVNDIRLDDIYGGLQVKILGKLDNIRFEFCVDVATGDPIIPSEINYDYKCLVTGETIPLKVYSLESVISEKLQTIFLRQITNSRSKDFYDLYILRKTQIKNVDIKTLKDAYKATCKYRNFSITKEAALLLIKEIGTNTLMNNRWVNYTKRNNYAYKLNFKDVIDALVSWIDDIL